MAIIDNLVAYWALEEASGSRADSFGANTLTDNNTVTQNPGKIANAAQFTRANTESLSIADNTDLSTGDVDFSAAMWLYLDTKTNTMIALGKYSTVAGTSEYRLRYDVGADRFIWSVFGPSSTAVTAGTFGSPSVTTWYYVVGWHDSVANQIGISVNAGTADTAAMAGGANDTATQFQLSGDSTGGNMWDGRIDEVGFWKRVLSSGDRTALYNAGNGVTYPFTGVPYANFGRVVVGQSINRATR